MGNFFTLTNLDSCLYVIELPVGFETNLYSNVKRKEEKYKHLIKEQSHRFRHVKLINRFKNTLWVSLPMSALVS